ncbi:MAG: hypothetical protein Q8L89_09385 [Gammaproteobacteria bacterium]|nr:hypothetical protein [Gammaproteobacteria bacterium]
MLGVDATRLSDADFIRLRSQALWYKNWELLRLARLLGAEKKQ